MPHASTISVDQMKQVLDVSRLLTVTSDLDLLLRRIAEAACRLLACERASIFLHDPRRQELWSRIALESEEIRFPCGAGIAGHAFTTKQLLHVSQPYRDTRFNPEPDRLNGFITRSLLASPMLGIEGVAVGVLQAINKRDGDFDAADEARIQLLSDQAGVAVQRYDLQRAAVEAVSLRREMELARSIQEALIPVESPRVGGIEAAGWSKTASITGGDCYDLWKTANGRLGIFLADATGHGIGPAIVVSQARALVRALCDATGSARQVLAAVNARLCEDLRGGRFVTAFLGFLEAPDGMLDWCSAGQAPILFRARPTDSFRSFDAVAPPLGILTEFSAEPVEPARLDMGGVICVPSDGIIEARSPRCEQFGVRRVIEHLSNDDDPPERLASRMKEAVRTWQGGEDPADDQTIVVARRVRA